MRFFMASIVISLMAAQLGAAQPGQPEPAEPAVPAAVEPAKPSLAAAHELFMGGSYAEAIEAFKRLAEEPDKALPAGIGLARCRLQVGEYETGLDQLLKLRDADPAERADTARHGGSGGQRKSAEGTGPQSHEGMEGPRNDGTEERRRDVADWHELIARFHLRLGNYEKTLDHARKAIQADGNFAPARRLLAETLEYLGRRDEAIEAYRWFDQQIAGGRELPRDPEWITHTAVGFTRFSVLTKTNVSDRTEHALQQMLQVAYTRLDRSYWPARLAAADLLREKYNNSEHDGSVSDYEAALKSNPKLPEAHVGLGEVALDGWQFELVEEQVAKALAVNPRFAPALHLSAKKSLLERRYEQAKEVAEQALTVNPNDLTALSLSAAASACRYDKATVAELAAQVAAINPTCALFHRTLGDALGGIRQYAASEKEYEIAIELDPTDANARTELGMMYMQWGLEDKARDALDGAWVLDAYNQRTKFTLDLLDKLQHFAKHDTENFEIRHDDAKDPGLGEYVADYLEPIYHSVTGDYQTPLDVKTMIEFFPTHRTFGVRITGKPWIHTIGACTGRVIALATPRESVDLMGRYNLARVITHEFTHTVTLAATENRIPHWFTEGLAVLQEDAARPFDWMEILADAVRRERLFTLESIDWGFMRPKLPTDRQMAYAQSEWMCEYIIERFGSEVIRKMLDGYRAGRTQPEVFSEHLKIELADFDREFAAWARKHAGNWGFDLTRPGDLADLRKLAESQTSDAQVFGRLASAELDENDLDRALAAAGAALEREPGNRLALEVRIKALVTKAAENPDARDAVDEQLRPAVRKLLEVDPDSWTALKAGAEIAIRTEDWADAKMKLQRLQKACRADPFSFRALAAIYLQDDDEESALPHLLHLAHLEQTDPAVAATVADIVRRKSRLNEASYWYRQALAIDPFDIGLHEELAEVSQQTGDYKAALREYRMLIRLEPRKAKHYEAAATVSQRLGDMEGASEYARSAITIDPSSPARSLLEPKP